MAQTSSARFCLSEHFWKEAKGDAALGPEEKKAFLIQILRDWDGTQREAEPLWRSESESKLVLPQDVIDILDRARAAGMSRNVAVLSAFVQYLHKAGAGPKADKPAQTPSAKITSSNKEPGGDLPIFFLEEEEDAPVAQGGLNPSQVQALKEKISALRRQAIEVIKRRQGYVFALQDTASGGDEADRSDAQTLSEINQAELIRSQSLLVEADAALERMRSGEYGYCEETGEPIGWARLQANPLARYCVEVQDRLERKRKLGLSV